MNLRSYQEITPVIGKDTYIDKLACIIGNVTLGDDCSIWPMAVLRGDVERISIGDRTNIQDGSICHVTHYGQYNTRGYPLTIGNDVTVGHRAILHACTIGNRCLIGMGTILLDGAVIEDDVMIGAGALVTPGKKLASGYLYVGNPVKQVRKLSEEEIHFLKYSAAHYCELKDTYLTRL